MRDYSQGGKPAGDYTQWTTFRDHANKLYYWKTYNDPGMKAVDLKTLDFNPGQPTRYLEHRRRQADGADGLTGAVFHRHAVGAGRIDG